MGKFIHAADIHLDSPLRGLERYDGAPEHVGNATRRAFDNLIQLAIDEAVDFVLIAGDLYDSDWRDYNTGLYFASRMHRLREAGIKVFIVRGNHDAANLMTRSLKLPDNVYVFSHEKPERFILEDLGVVIHGQSFASGSVTDNLARGYPVLDPAFLNIGMLHTSLSGREGHEPYAPCSVEELINKGYDYWALGHVHRREVVHAGSPWIVYPGNLQGRHINEEGPKGCTLVTFQGKQIMDVAKRHVDVLRWARCVLDCRNASSPDDVLDHIRTTALQELEQAAGLPVVFRFELHGSSLLHGKLMEHVEHWVNEIRAAVMDATHRTGWVEKVKFRTTSRTGGEEAVSPHLPRGFLKKYFAELTQDAELLEELRLELDAIRSKLPGDLFRNHPDLDWDNPTVFQELLADAKRLAEAKLANEEVIAHED